MNVLFIDTHNEKVTIIIKASEKEYRQEATSNRSHSEILMPTLDEVLKSSKININEIDEIIVVNGPGSFTGVRMGVTVAKTIAYTLSIPIKTITSLEMYGVSSDTSFDIVSEPDSKGVYSVLKENDVYKDFKYQKSSEFLEYVNENHYKVLDDKKIDLDKIIEYLKDSESINPHLVNPIYIKEIDALK